MVRFGKHVKDNFDKAKMVSSVKLKKKHAWIINGQHRHKAAVKLDYFYINKEVRCHCVNHIWVWADLPAQEREASSTYIKNML